MLETNPHAAPSTTPAYQGGGRPNKMSNYNGGMSIETGAVFSGGGGSGFSSAFGISDGGGSGDGDGGGGGGGGGDGGGGGGGGCWWMCFMQSNWRNHIDVVCIYIDQI